MELCIIRIEMNAQAEGRHDPGNIRLVQDIEEWSENGSLWDAPTDGRRG